MSRKNESQNQWLEMLTADFGGWWGFGFGAVMALYGAVMGLVVVLAGGSILMIGAVLLNVVGWFKNR